MANPLQKQLEFFLFSRYLPMNLSPKALRFIIEALDYRIQAYQEQLEADSLNEDSASDIGNDAMYLDALRQELLKASNAAPQLSID